MVKEGKVGGLFRCRLFANVASPVQVGFMNQCFQGGCCDAFSAFENE